MSFCCFDALFAGIKDKVTPYSQENTNYGNQFIPFSFHYIYIYNKLNHVILSELYEP